LFVHRNDLDTMEKRKICCFHRKSKVDSLDIKHLALPLFRWMSYIVAYRLQAGISESERPSIVRQRLGNQFSCIIVWVTMKGVHATTQHRQTFPAQRRCHFCYSG
jgi:hypothetical protein